LKTTLHCTNNLCWCKLHVAWTLDGDIFMKDGASYTQRQEQKFIDDNDAPFGSFQRKCNIEIYKKDENYQLLKFSKWKVNVIFLYTADEDGKILKRKRKLEIWKKYGEFGYTMWTNPFKMIMFSISQYRKKREGYFTYTYCDLDEYRKPIEEWKKKEWWRRVSHFLCSTHLKYFPVKEGNK
jgi:hypothetical protein